MNPDLPLASPESLASHEAVQSEATTTPVSSTPDILVRCSPAPNKKQQVAPAEQAKQKALALRQLHWPDVKDEELWILGTTKRGGFAQVPRPLSLVMNMINEVSKADSGKASPAGKTYLVLWLHIYGEGLVRIDSEAEAAFEAGYGGERNVTTFRKHMHVLRKYGFVDFRRGPRGPMQYVLMNNPYKVVKRHHQDGLVSDTYYSALLDRASAIGSSAELE